MAQWPPPPDLESITELVTAADVEGFVADGAPADEYEMEAEEIHEALSTWATAELTAERIEPILADIWQGAFQLDEAALALRGPKLQALAAEIAKFFGPEAKPQVRGSN